MEAPKQHFQSGLNCSTELNSILLSKIKDRDLRGVVNNARFNNFVKSRSEVNQRIQVLDIGSAEGLFLRMFTSLVPNLKFDFVCVDPNLQETSSHYDAMCAEGHTFTFSKQKLQVWLSESNDQHFDLIFASHVTYYMADLLFTNDRNDFWSILRSKLSIDGLLIVLTMSQAAQDFNPRNDKQGALVTLWNVEKVAYGPCMTMVDNLAGKMGITAEMIVRRGLNQYVTRLPDCILHMLSSPITIRSPGELPESYTDLLPFELEFMKFITRSRYVGPQYTDALRQDLYQSLKTTAAPEGIAIVHPGWLMVVPKN